MNRLSLFGDISGRPFKESQATPSFAVGGVILATAEEDDVRAAIGPSMLRWRDSDAESLSLIEGVLRKFDIHCTSLLVRKTEPAWAKFWAMGDSQFQRINSEERGNQRLFMPGNVLKGWAFQTCFSRGLGTHLGSRGKPSLLGPDGLSPLYLRYVCDTDIQGQRNRDVFVDALRKWSRKTALPSQLGIKPEIDRVEFRTEQEDNLLILPDYLAGYVLYSSDPERISPPVSLSPQDLRRFGQTLSSLRESNPVRFSSKEMSFDRVFPNLISKA